MRVRKFFGALLAVIGGLGVMFFGGCSLILLEDLLIATDGVHIDFEIALLFVIFVIFPFVICLALMTFGILMLRNIKKQQTGQE